MPSIITQYTPLESLLFLQSVARNGADPSTLSTISRSLRTNPFVQGDGSHDADRLSPEALESLYNELMKAEDNAASVSVNGNNPVGQVNPLKRKLSSSPDPCSRSENTAWKESQTAERLYAKYRERMVQGIKDEENKYQALVAEIKTLEDETKVLQKSREAPVQDGFNTSTQPQSSSANRSASPATDWSVPTGTPANDGSLARAAKAKEEQERLSESKLPQPPPGQMLPPQTPGLESSFSRSPSVAAITPRQTTPGQRGSPAPPNSIPLPDQQQPQSFLPRYAPIQPPLPLPSAASPRQSNSLPPISSMVPQPPPPKAPPPQRKPSGSVPPRKSPLLPSPSPPYQQQLPYGYPYPAWPQYHSPHSPYVNPQFYHQQPMPRNLPPAQSPTYNQYSPYHHPGPMNQYGAGPYPRPQMPGQAPQYNQFPWPNQPASASTTPLVQRSVDRRDVRVSGGTSTPWTPGGVRYGSPERPVRERDVSPLSDRGASPEQVGNDTKEVTPKNVSNDKLSKVVPNRGGGRGRSRRGARAGSTHSSALASRSRSQSLTSVASETRAERAVGTQPSIRHIKHEPPATPTPLTSDSEQKSSGRRRGRTEALHPPPSEIGRSGNKRKRESVTEPSLSPTLPTPRPFGTRIRPRAEPSDPSLVAISKNFARKAAQILNDVNAHKHAGVFAKPLTQRDAPGYKDLIYRPQDLKSIRAAVGRGSRAANALLDEMDVKAEEASMAGSPAAATIAKGTTPSGSTLVSKSADLTPPKGIVNSAQLEMEFMRIFANAVMFNPLPPSERGLPPGLKMQRDGAGSRGTKSRRSKVEEADQGGEEEEEEADAEKKGYAQEEEGDIIHDTREMFQSVDKAVAQWRSVEQGYIDDVPRTSAGVGGGGVMGLGLGLRGGSASVSVSDAVAEESAQEDNGESMHARKRRRLVE